MDRRPGHSDFRRGNFSRRPDKNVLQTTGRVNVVTRPKHPHGARAGSSARRKQISIDCVCDHSSEVGVLTKSLWYVAVSN